jgi:hypothetical protein
VIGRLYGIKPWETHRLTVREMEEIGRDLRELERG